MSAHPLQFSPGIQEPLEAGWISPRQAWLLDQELTVLRYQPWTPEGLLLNCLLQTFHNPQDQTLMH